jgi:putative membrane protein
MTEDRTASDTARFTVRTTPESHFAWLRTRLALERTMMAWVRTAVSLIAFGFTIVQFFDRLQEIPGTTPAVFPDAPRYLGLALIGCGVAALLISIWEYRWTVGYLWNRDYISIAGMTPEGKRSPLVGVAVVLTLVGIFAFFAVLLRLV